MKAKIIAICSVLGIAIILMCYVVFIAGTDFMSPKVPTEEKNYAYADPNVKNPNKNNDDGTKLDDYKEELPPDPNQNQGTGNSGGNNNPGGNGNNTNNNNNGGGTTKPEEPTIKSIIGKEKSFSFSIKGVSISMPMRYGDLKAKLGAIMMEDFENTIAPGAKYQATGLMIDSSKLDAGLLTENGIDTSKLMQTMTGVTISIENLTSKSIAVQDATVTSVSVMSNPAEVYMSKGITGSSTVDAITAAYGTPDNDVKLGMRLMYYKLPNLNHHDKEVGVEITTDLKGAVKMIRYGTFDPTYESAIKFLLENGEKIINNDIVKNMITGQKDGESGNLMEGALDLGGLFGDFLKQW